MMTEPTPRTQESEDLEEELARLSHQQYLALQKDSYLRMSAAEAAEYDKRRIRIGEICGLLARFRRP